MFIDNLFVDDRTHKMLVLTSNGVWGVPEIPSGSLARGSWAVVVGPQDSTGRLWAVPQGSLGGPGGSWGRGQEAQKSYTVFSWCLGASGGPWGDFGGLEWSTRPTSEVHMLIFAWFHRCLFAFDILGVLCMCICNLFVDDRKQQIYVLVVSFEVNIAFFLFF